MKAYFKFEAASTYSKILDLCTLENKGTSGQKNIVQIKYWASGMLVLSQGMYIPNLNYLALKLPELCTLENKSTSGQKISCQ